jgi:hypothetical protein
MENSFYWAHRVPLGHASDVHVLRLSLSAFALGRNKLRSAGAANARYSAGIAVDDDRVKSRFGTLGGTKA